MKMQKSNSMEQISIKLRKPSQYGRLYYYRDPQIEENILFLQNNVRRQQTYTINISSLIILGLDINRLLKSIEVIYPRRSWIIEETMPLPETSIPADLEITNLIGKNAYLELPIKVFTDYAKSHVYVSIGEAGGCLKWVNLSDHCFALLQERLLKGFYVNLIGSELKDNPTFKLEKE
jgi:hypothetical protein